VDVGRMQEARDVHGVWKTGGRVWRGVEGSVLGGGADDGGRRLALEGGGGDRGPGVTGRGCVARGCWMMVGRDARGWV